MTFDLRQVPLDVVRDLCARHHGYGSAGAVSVYAWAVLERGLPVAAYAWQPPPPGAARSVCPEAPAGVLALSRMVAVPKEARALKHVSKPLRVQMKGLIDRTRWPVLVTFSDEGQGHTGYVYRCSGWTPTERHLVPVLLDADGRRASRYSDGRHMSRSLTPAPPTWVQRWEHRACPAGETAAWMARHGWHREPTGGTLRSGNPEHRWVRDLPLFHD